MKKILLSLSVLSLVTTSAVAKKIDINTKIKWNPNVVVASAESAGLRTLLGNGGLVYNKILFNLLQRDTFSLKEAGEVCRSEFADYVGYEEYNNKVHEIYNKCEEDFVLGLVNANNRMSFAGNIHSQTKVYTNDKLYYAMETDTVYSISNGIECRYAAFETATDKIVATCDIAKNYNENAFGELLAGKADTALYYILYNENPNGSDPENFLLVCGVMSGSDRFGVCDRLVYKPGEYKELYGGDKRRP